MGCLFFYQAALDDNINCTSIETRPEHTAVCRNGMAVCRFFFSPHFATDRHVRLHWQHIRFVRLYMTWVAVASACAPPSAAAAQYAAPRPYAKKCSAHFPFQAISFRRGIRWPPRHYCDKRTFLGDLLPSWKWRRIPMQYRSKVLIYKSSGGLSQLVQPTI